MNILFICEAFPPDTVIGGIRPFMFAKYMMLLGHNVTIINSGKCFSKTVDSFDSYLARLEIYSAYSLTQNSSQNSIEQKKKNYPGFIKRIYCGVNETVSVISNKKHFNELYHKQQVIIDSLSGRHFDVVFSTYSPVASIYSGEYAARKFNCKWILDFRDALVQPNLRTWLWNFMYYNTQKRAVEKCDLCTVVSNGVGRMVSVGTRHSNIVTLYNGYDSFESKTEPHLFQELSLCYTGGIYGERMKAFKRVLKAIAVLKDEAIIKLENVRINYAGSQSESLRSEMRQLGLEQILHEHGFLSVSQCEALQRNSDIFLVLSWNTKKEQGILTGKFYEGVRAKMPMIVSVVGDTPYSELSELNSEYHYGVCDEEALGDSSLRLLCDFIRQRYDEKMKYGRLNYVQDPRLTEKFKYENLTREFESLCSNILNND